MKETPPINRLTYTHGYGVQNLCNLPDYNCKKWGNANESRVVMLVASLFGFWRTGGHNSSMVLLYVIRNIIYYM